MPNGNAVRRETPLRGRKTKERLAILTSTTLERGQVTATSTFRARGHQQPALLHPRKGSVKGEWRRTTSSRSLTTPSKITRNGGLGSCYPEQGQGSDDQLLTS